MKKTACVYHYPDLKCKKTRLLPHKIPLKQPIAPKVFITHTNIIHILKVLVKTRRLIYHMTILENFEILTPKN
jgi:hypothetical protein